jgi:hypothetical protein
MEKREHYASMLGLNRFFTKEQLETSFYERMSEIQGEDNINNEVIVRAVNYNEAINYLRPYSSTTCGDNSIVLNKLCSKFGLNIYEVQSLFMKRDRSRFIDLDDFIKEMAQAYEENVKFARYTLEIMRHSKSLWTIAFDRLSSIFYCDTFNMGENINTYVSELVKICNGIEKLDSNFRFETELAEFLNSKEKNFITFLKQKLSVKYYCNELGIEEYNAKFEFDYNKPEEFKGSLNDYLKLLVEVKRMSEELGLTTNTINLLCEEYRKIDPKADKYTIIKDFYEVRDFCNYLPILYLEYKEKYYAIPEDKRVSDFVTWMNINKVKAETGLSSDQLLEQIFNFAKGIGYGSNITLFLSSVVELNKDENNKEKKLS